MNTVHAMKEYVALTKEHSRLVSNCLKACEAAVVAEALDAEALAAGRAPGADSPFQRSAAQMMCRLVAQSVANLAEGIANITA